jgi:hypothetical protein
MDNNYYHCQVLANLRQLEERYSNDGQNEMKNYDLSNVIVHKETMSRLIMTNWHDSLLMIVKSADPTIHEGASLKKMLNELEALLANGHTLKSTTECNGEIFAFLLNESELSTIRSRTTTTTIEEHESEE